ncbi:site-specific integrase [Butyricicoccus sp. 1XD8-22]|nr:site-specific integrase [Butyricicoccus sp. 1XD8-22]
MTNSKKIEKNMLRERAKKLPEVTPEMYEKVDLEYRQLTQEFIKNQGLSPKSQRQYESVIRQFGWFLYTQLRNKPFHKITKRDFLNYLSYLREDRKMSSSAIGIRKSVVSSFCNYLENIIVGEEDFQHYDKFRNFTRGLPAIPKTQTYDKVKVTRNEFLFMMEELEKREHWLGMAWLATAFNVGARRAEIIQFPTNMLEQDFPEDIPHIMSPTVRGKCRGEDGKPLQYMINKEAFNYMKLWIEKRGYEHEYIFTTKHNGEYQVMDESWADYFCSNVLSEMLGRRINVHIFKASAVTFLLESGVPIELVSKFVAHHEDVLTTMKHYDLRDFEEERNSIFSTPNKTE